MSKSSRRIVAIVLLAAFIIWMIFTVFPFGDAEVSDSSGIGTPQSYEPEFSKEGELWIQSGEGDTLATLDIEIAESDEEVQYGMMYRKHMAPNTGMLFLMGEERPQSFWMKNTYIPLDIIYINSNKEIVSIQKNAEPLSEKSLPSEGPASFVLEVPGGFSDSHQLQKGSIVNYRRAQ